MTKRDRIILQKIIEEADILMQVLCSIDEEVFLASEEKKRTTCMTLINIGELVKNLNMEIRTRYASIPWKRIAGFRDVASHGYFLLRLSEVWVYASQEVPLLRVQIKEILANEKEGKITPEIVIRKLEIIKKKI